MRLKMKNILPFLFLCLAMLGCKKNPFDYRTKYIGKWEFVVQSHSWTPNSYKDTTYTTVGRIDYGGDKDEINIHVSGSSGFIVVEILEDGTINSGSCKGEFETKSKVRFYCHGASPASGTHRDVTGTKQ